MKAATEASRVVTPTTTMKTMVAVGAMAIQDDRRNTRSLDPSYYLTMESGSKSTSCLPHRSVSS